MPKLPILDSLRRRWKRSISSGILKLSPVFDVKGGEEIVITYTSTSDKMKVFSAFVGEGLEGGDAVWYTYPDEESEVVRAKLEEHDVEVEKYEKDGALRMEALSEGFKTNGRLDLEKSLTESLEWWAWAKKQGYKHARGLEDLGDLSFFEGQWQKYMAEYWADPRWDDPAVSEWVRSKEQLGVVYDSFLMEATAINVEHMTETQVSELLKSLGAKDVVISYACIDLIENIDLFSRSIGLDHQRLVGRKILVEYDPISNYEKIVDSLAKESRANVEPVFVFTSSTSPIHTHLAGRPAVKFFSTSLSTSAPESISESEVLLPAKSVSLILEALSKVLETYTDGNVCFVFDILSQLLTTLGSEKTLIFLRHALDMLSSEKITGLFLLNTGAHQPEVAFQIRGLFQNLLAHKEDGLEIVKIS